jgi:hypothetical protein
MANGYRKNGFLEIKFNDDRTQAIATIQPPAPGGEAVTASEILERLKSMGVTYGVREQAILDAIHKVLETHQQVGGVVVAQGAIPTDGLDAKVRYRLPIELLSQPLPKLPDAAGLPDWFSLDPAKMVKADEELAAIIPPQPGTPGKTLTWPIQAIAPKPGKPAALSAGANVRVSTDGTRLSAALDGYACLQGEQLTIHALRILPDSVDGGAHSFAAGAVFQGDVQNAQVRVGTFAAIRGKARDVTIRAHGDVILHRAENCNIIAGGCVYVLETLANCQVNTRKKVIALRAARIVGGDLCATEGVEAVLLGAEDFTATEVICGVDRLTPLRSEEIEEELAACETNIARISQVLRPFAAQTAHETLPDDKRRLLSTLQAQKRSQEARINDLHNERRSLSILSKETPPGLVVVTGTVYPGVWIGIGKTAIQIETALEGVRFTEGAGGKRVEVDLLQQAA